MKIIKLEYLKILLVFTIGIIIAIMVVNSSGVTQKVEIKNYIDTKIRLVKEGEYTNQNEVFVYSLKRNLKDFFIMFFLASTIIGIPIVYGFIVKKAFSIGYTSACISATQSAKSGIIFICNAVVLHNIIYITSIGMVLVAGIGFVKAIGLRQNSIKYEILRYLVYSIIALILMILASLCEAYVSINFLYLLKKYV